MMSPRKGGPTQPLILTLAGLAFAAALAVGLQASERASSEARLYGYTVLAGPASADCGFDYIDLTHAGAPVSLQPVRADAASDDGGAVLAFEQPFELYQSPVSTWVVSGNGYLAAAESLAVEDGADFSNDCNLPVRADNAAASQNRIYVYHDDLRQRAGGEVRQAYFPDCPRNSASGHPEACTVVEWNGFERVEPIPSSRPLRAQAVLYHDSQGIALQYASVDDSAAAQATIGLQGFDARAATQAGCNQRSKVAAGQAICFFDPRHRPRARVAAAD
ncbi:MAG: hypothetical protein DCF27_03815 [Lysobacteraceae bacterium]|nr:MAG: hypothetical protein DCF27_03815 [Xanthomonadaceae bacterium]